MQNTVDTNYPTRRKICTLAHASNLLDV